MSASQPKVGLVLGAGGVLGGAWLVGALHALATETGWDPGSADAIVGTSAGSMVGALCACGVPPWFMVAHSAGEMLHVADDADRSAGATFGLHPSLPSLGPGSWRLALGSLARPYRHAPAAMVAGWLPQGLVSTSGLQETIGRVAGDGWAPHPGLRIIACDYETGRRVRFGDPEAPPASLAEAVAASCAVPGFYRPVSIDGRVYVDGGIRSTSNLDVLAGAGLDLVICLNPMSSLHARRGRTLGSRAAAMMRHASGRRLGREARRVRDSGSDVVLLQPTVVDLDAMGTNLMNRSRRDKVVTTAVASVTEHLRESGVGERLRALPPGISELVRRPAGPASSWPRFDELAQARWAAARPPAARRARRAG